MCTGVHSHDFVGEIYAPQLPPRALRRTGGFLVLPRLLDDDHVPPAGPAAFLRGRALPEERRPLLLLRDPILARASIRGARDAVLHDGGRGEGRVQLRVDAPSQVAVAARSMSNIGSANASLAASSSAARGPSFVVLGGGMQRPARDKSKVRVP